MFILSGGQVPKKDWRSMVALCFIFFLARIGAANATDPFVRPDPFPEVWCLE
ncbi:MAG: hypothetical protein WBB32_03965 [Flavobacteriales bacterium]